MTGVCVVTGPLNACVDAVEGISEQLGTCTSQHIKFTVSPVKCSLTRTELAYSCVHVGSLCQCIHWGQLVSRAPNFQGLCLPAHR